MGQSSSVRCQIAWKCLWLENLVGKTPAPSKCNVLLGSPLMPGKQESTVGQLNDNA